MTNNKDHVADVIAAYGGQVHDLLAGLANSLEMSLLRVDRATVEANVESPPPAADWAAVAAQFGAMDFDDDVGDHGAVRTDRMEAVLERAGVAGCGWHSCSGGSLEGQTGRKWHAPGAVAP